MAAKKSDDVDLTAFTTEAPQDTIPVERTGFSIDLASIPDVNTPLPPGLYDCTIVHAEPTTSQAGNPMISLRWRVLDGEHADRIIFDNLVFTETALWHIREVLLAIGTPVTFNGDVDPEMLLGERATLEVVIKESNKINPETQEVYPPRNNIKHVHPLNTKSRRTVEDLF